MEISSKPNIQAQIQIYIEQNIKSWCAFTKITSTFGDLSQPPLPGLCLWTPLSTPGFGLIVESKNP